jgi:group I intron endonuclease
VNLLDNIEYGNIGIYKITCTVNNKIYIGSTIDIRKRVLDHVSRLKRNSHSNPYLQNTWNKYGENNFEIHILETCTELLLLEVEQRWLNNTRAYDREIGFNITTSAYNVKVTSKDWVITDPNGIKFEITNLGKFCRKHKLNQYGLSHVANGRANQWKGWTCRKASMSIEDWKSSNTRSRKGGTGWDGDWLITYPNGNTKQVKSLTHFCKENKLSQGNMSEVADGKRKQHKGFSCIRVQIL